MTGNAIVDASVVIAIFLALIAFYTNVSKRIDELTGRMKTTEDCVESELKDFREKFTESLNAFKLEVTNRLTAIEVAIKKNNEK